MRRRRRPLAATMIASAALALGAAGPASAAPSAELVWGGSATPSALPQLPRAPLPQPGPAAAAPAGDAGQLSVAVQVPMLEDPAEVAAARAATLPSTGVDVPLFLAAAVAGGLLGLGLCVVAARRA